MKKDVASMKPDELYYLKRYFEIIFVSPGFLV